MILGGDTPWLRQLAETPLSERMALLNALIVTEFRVALLMDDGEVLPPEESYFALGLTSLGATEIQERLQVIIGRRIDSASLFDNPTIRHLTAFLRSQVLPEFFAALFPVEDGSAIPENVGADAASNEHRNVVISKSRRVCSSYHFPKNYFAISDFLLHRGRRVAMVCTP